ncbi:hypothetical protein ACFFHJ_39540 [Planotetraspora thailandica]|nr:hypothetical protein [Planotetraspora thailandica]
MRLPFNEKWVVGEPFEGRRLVLLHHVGRITGRERVTPPVAAGDGSAPT